jgi:hypothetical protein
MIVRPTVIIVVALVVIGGCSSGSATEPRAQVARRTVTPATSERTAGRVVHFNVATPPPVALASVCDTHSACLVPVKGPEFTVTGDSIGSGVNAGAAYLLPGNAAISSALATFSGEVKGCGSGTAILRYDAHYGVDQPGGGSGSWAYIDGTGRGALARISGGGTFRLVSAKPDLSAVARFTGTIDC